ncbi:MAG: FliH/SctL family protein [Caldimicrobium sp.]
MSKIIKAEKLLSHKIIQPKIEISENFSPLLELKEEMEIMNKEEEVQQNHPSPEESYTKAYAEGYNKGYEEGLAKGEKEGYERGLKLGLEEAEKRLAQREEELKKRIESELAKKKEEIEIFIQRVDKELRDLILNLDQEILRLALDMAKKIVLKEIEVDRELLLRIIREALNYIVEGTEILIKVNPEEYSFLQNKIEIERAIPLRNYKVKITPDTSISKGGLFIETKMGIIDATFEKRWEKLLSQLEIHAS